MWISQYALLCDKGFFTLQSPTDEQTPVSALKTAVEAFYAARNWQRYHSPKNLAMSIAIEAAELMEIYQWAGADESDPQRARLAEELADVLIYCLTLANVERLDLTTIILQKIEANGRKYPVPADPDEVAPIYPVNKQHGE